MSDSVCHFSSVFHSICTSFSSAVETDELNLNSDIRFYLILKNRVTFCFVERLFFYLTSLYPGVLCPAIILVKYTDIHLEIQSYISTYCWLTYTKTLKKESIEIINQNFKERKYRNNKSTKFWIEKKKFSVWQKLVESMYFLTLTEEFTNVVLAGNYMHCSKNRGLELHFFYRIICPFHIQTLCIILS